MDRTTLNALCPWAVESLRLTLLTALLLGLASLATKAQEPGGVLRGKVMDRVLKSPLPGANLQWMCAARGCRT